ncbi:hypothetical protein D1007_32159 [Hordeum vulgare]|nr:hypothetical protein D1007_32159 [Hordeum vulgare]
MLASGLAVRGFLTDGAVTHAGGVAKVAAGLAARAGIGAAAPGRASRRGPAHSDADLPFRAGHTAAALDARCERVRWLPRRGRHQRGRAEGGQEHDGGELESGSSHV